MRLVIKGTLESSIVTGGDRVGELWDTVWNTHLKAIKCVLQGWRTERSIDSSILGLLLEHCPLLKCSCDGRSLVCLLFYWGLRVQKMMHFEGTAGFCLIKGPDSPWESLVSLVHGKFFLSFFFKLTYINSTRGFHLDNFIDKYSILRTSSPPSVIFPYPLFSNSVWWVSLCSILFNA
jgi:hypothetical protein